MLQRSESLEVRDNHLARSAIQSRTNGRGISNMLTGGPHLFFPLLESDLWSVRNFLTKARSALRSSLFHLLYVAHRHFRARLMVFIWRGKSAALRRGALPAARFVRALGALVFCFAFIVLIILGPRSWHGGANHGTDVRP